MKKALTVGLAVALFVSSGVGTFWLLESDPWIPGAKVVTVVNQLEGEATIIDVPTDPFSNALKEFTIQTMVRRRNGTVVESTPAQPYIPFMDYRFVTPRSLTSGAYEARVRIGYDLNPIRSRTQEFPLALIYVYPNKENK